MKTLFFIVYSLLISFSITIGQTTTTYNGGAEPCIVVNPLDSNHLAVAYMSDSNSVMKFIVHYSLNGGNSWTQSNFDSQALYNSLFTLQPLNFGDPVLSFDHLGTLHFTYIYGRKMLHVYSLDGGANFVTPPLNKHELDVDSTQNQILDRQWMACDNSGGLYHGNVYLCATKFGSPLSSGKDTTVVYVKPSDSLGFNKESINILPYNNGEHGLFSNIDVDQNGIVHVNFMRINASTQLGDYIYSKSLDGGQSFLPPVVVGSGRTAWGGQHSIIHYGDNSASSMRVANNNVYICWSDFSNSTVKSYYVYSNDAGNSFSSPIEFGPLSAPGPYFHIMPNVAASNNNMSLSWYLVDSTSKITSYVVANSNDNGSTISSSQIISGGTTNFNNPVVSSEFYGHYNSSVMVNCVTHSTWSDGRTMSPVVYHNKLDFCSVEIGEQTPVTADIVVGDSYPNPANKQLNIPITTNNISIAKYRIYSIDGQLISEKQASINFSNKLLVPINYLTNGNYLIQLVFTNGMYASRKFVVNH